MSGNFALKKVIKYSVKEKKFMIENGIDIKNVKTITVDYALDECVANEDIEKIWQLKEEHIHEYLFEWRIIILCLVLEKMKPNFIINKNKIKEIELNFLFICYMN